MLPATGEFLAPAQGEMAEWKKGGPRPAARLFPLPYKCLLFQPWVETVWRT